MFIPTVCPAKAVNGMSDKQLDNPNQQCMCDKHGACREKMMVFTTVAGQKTYNWFVVCDFKCYTLHVSEGNA